MLPSDILLPHLYYVVQRIGVSRLAFNLYINLTEELSTNTSCSSNLYLLLVSSSHSACIVRTIK